MRVLISGAGIAGLMLAHLLGREGHAVTIVEKASSLRGEGYMMDFFGAGYDVFEKLGLLGEIERIHYPIAKLAFVDEQGRDRVVVSYPTLRKLFDDRHFNFMRGDLEQLLYDRVTERTPIRFATTIESIAQTDREATVAFSDGHSDAFDLVVGADGIHSRVRSLVLGEESRFRRDLGYIAAAFIFDRRLPGFERTDAFSTLTVPRRQVAVYPIRGERMATFFMYKSDRDPALDAAHAREALKRVYADLGWIVPDLLSRAPETFYFDSVSQIEMPRWSERRVGLLGDACQCVSLIAGQGASMAVTGAWVLADELGRANGDVVSALLRYEARMRPAIEAKQKAGRDMAAWFVPDTMFRIGIRNLILRATGFAPISSILKRFFAAESSVKL